MEARRIWFEEVLNDTKKVVVQAGKHAIRNHPLLIDSLDDLVQDTYLELYKNYDRLQTHENITGWLVETMYRKAKDQARRLYRERDRVPVRIDGGADFEAVQADFRDMPEQSYARRERAEELRGALVREIGEDAYRLLEAHYGEGVPLGDLARKAGITPAALKMRFYRWRKRLRRKEPPDC